jgi:steroid 5-alpha reductase family enzyme
MGLQACIVIVIYFVIWYIIAMIIKNAGIIDIGWGLGFVVVAWFGFLQNINIVSGILTLMVSLWGLRLTFHIFKRNVGKPEDFRYANFRRQWGKTFLIRSLFRLFMFQAVLMFLISLAFIYGNVEASIVSLPLLIIGIIIWLIGFVFEAVGDKQLKRFITEPNNKGRLIETGLWKYTRHPNYFGEALLWWGIFIAALGSGAPWFTVLSPITITLVIRFVSGVPMLEKRNENKPGYDVYKAKTNIFIPWFPKGEKDE